jgi:type VI secretion system ImpA family protein
MSPAGGATISALLCPIAPHGTGADLRLGGTWRAIQEARREDDARLPQGIWTREFKRADWRQVETLCRGALAATGKDLQVAAWLAEAWLHLHGLAGLADGLDLLCALSKQFWPHLHPAIEDDDPAPRIATFDWMDRHFAILLRTLPIAQAQDEPGRAYSWTDLANAQLLERLHQRDPQSFERAHNSGTVTLDAFAEMLRRTAPEFLADLHAGLRAAAASLANLKTVLGTLCGADAPGFSAMLACLQEIDDFVAAECDNRGRVRHAARPERLTPAHTAPSGAPKPRQPQAGRADFYAQLADIAERLAVLEPHSPVPYMIRRAVAWGERPLPDLIADFAAAGFDPASVFDLLGIGAGEHEDF